MIPRYPDFVPLTGACREAIQAVIGVMPPYSNFNFVSMDSWNVNGTCMVSSLNDNSVVLLEDYLTGKSFYAAIGEKLAANDIRMLLRNAAANGRSPELRLVPEDSIRDLLKTDAQEGLVILEDRDAFDYVLDVDRLVGLAELPEKRRVIEKFATTYPDCRVELINLTNPNVALAILAVCKRWRIAKGKGDSETVMEFAAIRRCLTATYRGELIGLGAYVGEELVGFTINELLPRGWYMGHFGKALPAYRGLTDVLEHETAKVMQRHGCQWMNFQEDLGLQSLRSAKLAWQPTRFLKKFTITFAE